MRFYVVLDRVQKFQDMIATTHAVLAVAVHIVHLHLIPTTVVVNIAGVHHPTPDPGLLPVQAYFYLRFDVER